MSCLKVVITSRGPVVLTFHAYGEVEVTSFDEKGWEAEHGWGSVWYEADPAVTDEGPAKLAELLIQMLDLEESEALQIAREALAEYSTQGGDSGGSEWAFGLVLFAIVGLSWSA